MAIDKYDICKIAGYIIKYVQGPKREKIKYSDILSRKELRKKRNKPWCGKLDNVFYSDLRYKQFEKLKQEAEQRLAEVRIPDEIVVRLSDDLGYWVVAAERKNASGNSLMMHLPI